MNLVLESFPPDAVAKVLALDRAEEQMMDSMASLQMTEFGYSSLMLQTSQINEYL